MNKLTNQKQFWFLLSGGKNASFLTCWGAAQRLPRCNSGSEPALLPFTYKSILSKVILRQYYLLKHVKDNTVIIICHNSVCVTYDLSKAGRST